VGTLPTWVPRQGGGLCTGAYDDGAHALAYLSRQGRNGGRPNCPGPGRLSGSLQAKLLKLFEVLSAQQGACERASRRQCVMRIGERTAIPRDAERTSPEVASTVGTLGDLGGEVIETSRRTTSQQFLN